jgi:glycosyltransferase involved in cell wall biosynthesis
MRESGKDRPKVLFITPVCPGTESHSGGLQVTLERLRELTKFANVTVAAINFSGPIDNPEQQLGVEAVHCAGDVRPRNAINFGRSLLSGAPLSVWRNMSAPFLALCKSLRQQQWDYVYADHWLVWPVARQFRNSCKVLSLHNAEHLLFARAAENHRFPVNQMLALEANRVKAYLRRATSEADEVHYLSAADELEARKTGCAVTDKIFYPGVPVEPDSYGQFGTHVFFAGTLSWRPNEEGLEWFMEQVRPLLPQDVSMSLVGGMPNERLRALSSVGTGCQVTWHGRVPSVTPYYREASVFIAPLLSGSGIKIKILNALSYGIPVVTTSVGVEGFPRDWGDAIHVADTPQEFAQAINQLMSNETLWRKACADAKPYLMQHFSGNEFARWCASLTRGTL